MAKFTCLCDFMAVGFVYRHVVEAESVEDAQAKARELTAVETGGFPEDADCFAVIEGEPRFLVWSPPR